MHNGQVFNTSMCLKDEEEGGYGFVCEHEVPIGRNKALMQVFASLVLGLLIILVLLEGVNTSFQVVNRVFATELTSFGCPKPYSVGTKSPQEIANEVGLSRSDLEKQVRQQEKTLEPGSELKLMIPCRSLISTHIPSSTITTEATAMPVVSVVSLKKLVS